MTHSFKLSSRIARLRAPMLLGMMLTIFGCNSTDSLTPESSTPSTEPGTVSDPTAAPESDGQLVPLDGPALDASISSMRAGIPMGLFALPNSSFGYPYSGAERYIWPQYLLSNLAAIKARGGRVVLDFGGHEKYYKDASGHFSMTLWKQRIDKYRGVKFSSYVSDGTIVGHYLIDEPYDPYNWGSRIPGSTIEAMAKYSKSIWPNLPTIVRSESYHLGSGPFRYLDAAWAQYATYKGGISTYVSRNISDAKSKGLALIVGLNFLKGGPGGRAMSPSEVQSWGSTMLASSYPCAFLSWQYTTSISSSMKNAMGVLRSKAQNRATKSCRGA